MSAGNRTFVLGKSSKCLVKAQAPQTSLSKKKKIISPSVHENEGGCMNASVLTEIPEDISPVGSSFHLVMAGSHLFLLLHGLVQDGWPLRFWRILLLPSHQSSVRIIDAPCCIPLYAGCREGKRSSGISSYHFHHLTHLPSLKIAF